MCFESMSPAAIGLARLPGYLIMAAFVTGNRFSGIVSLIHGIRPRFEFYNKDGCFLSNDQNVRLGLHTHSA
jgi:hypothetical protein